MTQGIFDGFEELIASRRELYKHYDTKVRIALPESAKMDSNITELKYKIEQGTGIRFDAALLGEHSEASSDQMRVSHRQRATGRLPEQGLDETAMADFVLENYTDKLTISVPDGTDLLANVLVAADLSAMPYIEISVGNGSRLELLEWFASSGADMAPLQIVHVGTGAKADISIVHNETETAHVYMISSAVTGADSELCINSAYAGAAETKSATFAEADGARSAIRLNSIIVGSGMQSFDISAVTRNIGRETRTEAKTGSVLFDKAKCTTKDFAKVDKVAEGAYTYVEERGLLLGEASRFTPLPDMSIDTRNVSFASHSASSTPIDEKQAFYMMSRGLEHSEAVHSLAIAFLMKYLSGISSATAKEIAASIARNKIIAGNVSEVPELSAAKIWQ
ncbi:MAG: SufB/SufD family protein [Candidatus Micrarchaeia archaeon]